MTANELYKLDDEKFQEFISEVEDKWLQYSSKEAKVRAYFGTPNNGFKLFEKWIRFV